MTEAMRVVVFPRGQLDAKDKERFTKHGILAVEADDPSQVVQLDMSEPLLLRTSQINGDDFVRCALAALACQAAETSGGSITTSGRACHEFVKRLAMSIGAVVQ